MKIAGVPVGALKRDLEAYLGESFELSHLHPAHIRFRRVYAQRNKKLPAALKVITTSGKEFKLYAGVDAGFDRMHKRAVQAESLDIFPRCLWRDERALLLDFIPGQAPQFSSGDFAQAYGRSMARLHALHNKAANMERVRFGINRDLDCLSRVKLFRIDKETDIAALERALPQQIMSSMDYADNKPQNFLIDAQGALKFIDLGALRGNRPSGQYLCGSLFLRQLNREVFAESYLSAGGLPQVIENAKYLRMLHCIWSAALYVRKMQDVPLYLPMHKLSYFWLAKYLIIEFHRVSRNVNRDFCSI